MMVFEPFHGANSHGHITITCSADVEYTVKDDCLGQALQHVLSKTVQYLNSTILAHPSTAPVLSGDAHSFSLPRSECSKCNREQPPVVINCPVCVFCGHDLQVLSFALAINRIPDPLAGLRDDPLKSTTSLPAPQLLDFFKRSSHELLGVSRMSSVDKTLIFSASELMAWIVA